MDVVAMNIFESTMLSICREMGITLMKTSYSTIFNEALDFTCVLADAEGDMIAAGDFCPAHIGGMSVVIKACVQEMASEHHRVKIAALDRTHSEAVSKLASSHESTVRDLSLIHI